MNRAPGPRGREIAPGVVCLSPGSFVNVYLIGERHGPWWLVDTGAPWHFEAIRQEAAARFGQTPPEAILLTHGHFDHAGSARALAAYWRVPVHAAAAEMPFVTGRADYPPPDPTVGGPIGLAARLFPAGGRGLDLGGAVQPLTQAPPGWEIVPLPGHTPGQVGFFREADRVLLAGDALMTCGLDKWVYLLSRTPRAHLPPAAFTGDWVAARRSLRQAAAKEPNVLGCGHGAPLIGAWVPRQLTNLAEYAVFPRTGRYIVEPVRLTDNGTPILPPPLSDPPMRAAKALALIALTGLGLWCWARRREE